MMPTTSAITNTSTATRHPTWSIPTRRRKDPILEELWAVKAAINAEANYDVK